MSDFSQYKYVDTLPKSEKLLRFFWNIIWLFFFRCTPRWALNSWRIFLLRTFGASIGQGCKVAPSCFVWAPWNLVMGDFSVLGDGVDCYTMNKITIGSKVAVSQRAFLCTGSHDISSYRRPLVTKPIIIKDHVWVCAEAFVGPGVTIHSCAVAAARAVVINDIPELHVVGGNPAKTIKIRTIGGIE